MLLMQELNRFLEAKAGEGLSATTISGYLWRVLDFLKYFDEITAETIEAYLRRVEAERYDKYKVYISHKTLDVYRRILTQFMTFTTGKSQRWENPKKEGKKQPLLEIVLAESYVDDKKILRIKGSKLPALFSWCTAAKGRLDFNYAATRKLRKEHNRRTGIGNIRKVAGLKSKY